MQLTGAQALIKSLEMEHTEVVFGLPGGAILPAYDPILDSPIRHVLVRHEQGAGHMAEGYAHVTGRPGVVMVTSGPAATNLVTPLCDAYMDSVPMVAITGQVSRAVIGTDAFQEARHGRHHPFSHKAQRTGHERRRRSRLRSARPSCWRPRPARAGAARRAQGRPPGQDGVVLAHRRRTGGVTSRLQADHQGPPPHGARGGAVHNRLAAPGHLCGRRDPQGACAPRRFASWPN